jgi:hypothetical protein
MGEHMKKKFCKFDVGDHVVVFKSYLSQGNYKIHDRRTAIIQSIEEFAGDFTLTIKMDDDSVVTTIPEKNVEKT